MAIVEPRETSSPSAICRTGGDIGYGMFVTTAGLLAIGIDDSTGTEIAAPVAAPAPPRQTKAAMVLALLQREAGATLAELIEATGWLRHTTRAALTGLRKKGHKIDRVKRGDVTCYRVIA